MLHHTSATLQTLIRRRDEALLRGEAPSLEDLCRDQPELIEAFEREVGSRELLRLGVCSVGGGGEDGAFVPRAGAEPVPGYRLEARIGGGGSGEVWRAVGPGGFPVALKLVRMGEGGGQVEARPSEWLRKAREANLRSLELMREIRHPNLLMMFGAWERDGLLIIGMELADRTLMDRCDEAMASGQAGIPRGELLEYMRQVARGIDHLNTPGLVASDRERAGIQHRDVKPQNLLLVGDTVKVGDFGLAKLLDELVSQTGSLTPAYAAPELFNGQVSGRTDQYALAVTFCHLRGGRLPFVGSPWEVMMGHCMNPPDLGMLPEPERPAVARALAKAPEDRWPDCRSFVEAIAGAGAGAGAGARGRVAVGPGRSPSRKPAAPGRRLRLAALAGSVMLTTFAVVGLASRMASPPERPVPREGRRPAPAPAEYALARPPGPARGAAPDPAAAGPPAPSSGVVYDPAVAPASVPTPASTPAPDEPIPTGPPPRSDLETPREGSGPVAEGDATHPPVLGPPDAPPAPSGDVATPPARTEAPDLSPPAPVAAPSPTPAAHATAKDEEHSGPAAPSPRPVLAEVPPPPPPEASDPPVTSPEAPGPILPSPATIRVIMPVASAELAVRGAVGKGQPDEWYGPRRVIHTPPLSEGDDYLVGAFWMDPTRSPRTRNLRLRVEPGTTYEVDLRPDTPKSRTISPAVRTPQPPRGLPDEDSRRRPDPDGVPPVRK